jgi:hypothetical protein
MDVDKWRSTVVTAVYLRKCKWLWSLLGLVPVSSMCIDITLFLVTECYEVVSFEVLTWRVWRAHVRHAMGNMSIPTEFTELLVQFTRLSASFMHSLPHALLFHCLCAGSGKLLSDCVLLQSRKLRHS